MSESPIAEIFRHHFDSFVQRNGALTSDHYKVAHAIRECKTENMGSHVYSCPECNHELTIYNSCRNRHCPQCQAYASAQWVEQRIEELLPVQYFHVVFTIPEQLNPFALRNKKVFYSLMFRAVSETIKELGENRKFLGGTTGFIAILHTWGSNLLDHPHIHCIVPGGALSKDHSRWIDSHTDYLFPAPVMRTLFRGKLMAYFKDAVAKKSIVLHGTLQQYEEHRLMQNLINTLYNTEWVVYAKPSFANAEAVIKYLGSYTHRIAISDRRIKEVNQSTGSVTFTYKDYKREMRLKMTISCEEFIRRFMLHVVPAGFMRIRHFGFLSNRLQKTLLAVCKKLLLDSEEKSESDTKVSPVHWYDIIKRITGKDPLVCQECKKGENGTYRNDRPEEKVDLDSGGNTLKLRM
ncbi:Transposase [Chitinispirillum alkaliphilum]|nr:Transposase [Chitinispirillum alkaliphilum]